MDARQLALLARLPSARLIERQHFWGLPKRGIALILINALFWQPIWAQAEGIAVSGGTNTSVSQAGNGVPIVNIAAPNAAGLSHNQYQQYNVGSEGVILNNATTKTASTQLGGLVLGNGNLNGQAASTILNEVVGANASQLKGYTEVAGQGARVIVANPHGVTCDGCGFINTPRATLTTGTAVLNGNGQLDHFQVDKGNVAIEGQGLDASQVGQFEIITRAAQINAQINAQQLAVVAGRNDVDAQTLAATPRADNGSSKPTVAIDSSALGGMYANSIRLVGTEAGVGVRVAGNLAASAGDIQLGANGQLTVGQVAASGTVNVKAASASMQGTVYGSSVDVQTTGALNIEQNVAARDRINLASNGQITNSAIVEAGVNADNSRNATAQLTVTAQNLRNSGSLSASHTLQATASQALNNQGGTLNGQVNTQVSAGTLDNRGGRVLGQNALAATAGQVLNGQRGLIGSANTLTLNADQLSNGGGEISSQGTLVAQGRQADNSSNGRVLAGGDLTLNYDTLANQGGKIAGQQSVNLNLGSLDNSGQGSVKAARDVNLAATGAVNNSQGGELLSGAALSLASASLDNSQSGRMAGAGVTVATGALDNRNASLTSSAALTLTATQVDNSAAGRIASAMALTASVTGLAQRSGGRLFSNGDLSLDLNHGQLDNQGGLINAPGTLLLRNLATVNNQQGEISSQRAFSFDADALQNGQGSLLSEQALAVRIRQVLDNSSGVISGKGLDLRAGSLLNDGGNLHSTADLAVTADAALSNQNGELLASGNATVNAASLNNAGGQVSADQHLALNVVHALDNRAGTLGAGSGLDLRAASLDNRQAGDVLTDGDLYLALSGALANQAGAVRALGALNVQAGGVQNDGGRLSSQHDLTLTTGVLSQQGGKLMAGGNLTANATSLDNRAGGLVGANGALNLSAGEMDNRAGEISSRTGVTLSGQQLDNSDGGKLLAATALQLAVAQVINRSQGLISGDTLRLNGSQLDNSGGQAMAQNGATFDLTGSLLNAAGRIGSEAALSVTAATLDNTAGSLSSAGDLTITTTGAISNQQGAISTDRSLALASASLDNRNQGSLSGKVASNVTTGAFDNSHGGQLTSLGTLTLTAGQVTNQDRGRLAAAQAVNASVTGLDQQGGELFSQGSLALNLNHGQLDNQGGLIRAPGALLLTNLAGVNNQSGEISSAQAFELTALSLDNRQNGLVSSNGSLAVNVDTVDNRGGEISSKDTLQLAAQQLDNSDAGRLIVEKALTLAVGRLTNQSGGVLSGTTGVLLTGTQLNNRGGNVLSNQAIDLRLSGDLLNEAGLISSEGTLSARSGTLSNDGGRFSSASALSLDSAGSLSNRSGTLVTDGALGLHSASLDNSHGGTLSGKGPVAISTGDLDNSHNGRLSSADTLQLATARLTNQDGGSIGSHGRLSASVTGLDQNGGLLFSDSDLTLDLNHGQLDNQNGVINTPGALLLRQLAGVDNQGGEISSNQSFDVAALSLNNRNGRLLSNQALTLRIANALNNVSGLIAAASLAVHAGEMDNQAGQVISRNQLDLSVDGMLANHADGLIKAQGLLDVSAADFANQGGRLLGGSGLAVHATTLDNSDNGLINSQGGLNLTATSLASSNGGEVSALGDLALNLASLSQNGGRLIGARAVTLDLNGGDLNNQNGSISAQGQLTVNRLHDLDNRSGQVSSLEGFNLALNTLSNDNGRLISNRQLALTAGNVSNQAGLLSGWEGLSVTAANLDNRNSGTLSSRNRDVSVSLSGALLNSNGGALVSQQALSVSAASIDNRGGILSSAAEQTLAVSGVLDNSDNGLIDAGTTLAARAATLNNAAGTVNAQQALTLAGGDLNNSGGHLIGNAALSLDLLGSLDNTLGTLASGGDLVLARAAQVNNQGGQLASQRNMTLATGGLDNRNGGTVAAVDAVSVNAAGAVQNGNGGQLYSKNSSLSVQAASLGNGQGTLQSLGAMTLALGGDLDNQGGKLIAQNGALTLSGNALDNRGGLLASLQNAMTTRLTGVLKNGYDLNRQGGIVQAQRLDLRALGGLDNYGGRVAAQGGDALIDTGNANVDNRNGGIYASGLTRVTGHDFDNSGDNDGQIGGQQIDLSLSGALNNRLGVIESDSTLSIAAASLDNQTGAIRALGSSGATQLSISGLFDNRNGTLETANTDLALNAANLLNAGGSVLHVGSGTFGLSTANVINAGGSLVTRGGLTLTADSWTNSSVLQAGRLTLNVGTFTQTATGQLLASTALVGTGANWANDGVLASDGTLDLNLSGGYSGNGRASALGALGISAGQLSLGNAGSVAGGTQATLNLSGALANSGRLTSAGDMALTAGRVDNSGTLGSSGKFVLTTGALTNDHGLIFSGGDLSLRVASFTNSYADVYSLANLSIDRDGAGGLADSIVNSSASIQSDGSMRLAASTIQNVRAILTVSSSGIYTAKVTEIACIEGYNAGDCSGKRNHVWELVQRDKLEVTEASAASSITAGGNLTVTGGDLLNKSSTLSTGGNFQATLNNLDNTGVESSDTETSRIFRTQRVNNASGYQALANAVTSKYWYQSAGYNANDLSGMEGAIARFIASTEAELTQLNSTRALSSGGQSYAAVIQAAGNVSVAAQNNVNNSVVRAGYSYIGSGTRTDTRAVGTQHATRVTLNQQLAPDLAQRQINPLSLPGFSLPTGQNGLFRLSGTAGATATATQPGATAQSWTMTGATLTTAQRDQAVSAAPVRDIQGTAGQLSSAGHQASGGIASASALDTAVPGGAATPVRLADIAGLPAVGTVATGSAATPAQTVTDQTVSRVQGLPTTASKSNPNKYLIETNPALTDLHQFLNSDYLLAKLGYDPDDSAKRLGDGLYEQRLVQQAITARTGQAFIDGQTSNEAQFKYLMNNAIASKDELNLTVGVTLTSEQVAALTHDIVWLESQEVNGEQVLVPVVYLAQANGRLAPNGALIAGNDVSLIAGKDLTNVGTLKASNNLSAKAAGDLTNSGLIQAGSSLDLLAGNTIVNKAGGIIAGRDVSATAINGDVINERTLTTHQSSAGIKTEQRGFADSAARIEAANDLAISAGRDISNTGSVLQSGRDLTLQAGRDVNVASTQVSNSLYLDSNRNSSDITQRGASVTAGRDLSIQAGRDVSLVASQLEAKRDVAVVAGENLVVSSAANESHLYGKTKKVTAQEDHVSQVASGITAGGAVTATADQDVTLKGSQINAGTEAYVYAGDKLNVLAAENSDYSFYQKTKKKSGLVSSSSKSTLRESESTTAVGSAITSAGNITLGAENDLTVMGSQVESKQGAVKLLAGNDVQIGAVSELTKSRQSDKSSKTSWGGFKGAKAQGDVSETSTHAVGSLISGDSISVQAGRDGQVTGSSVVATHDITMSAGRDLTVEAATDTFSRDDSYKTKSHDFTGILTANKLGIDDITGNQHLSMGNSKGNGHSEETTLVASTVGSSEGNVSLSAGRKLGVVASDLVSTKDMSLAGSDVTIAAGSETASQKREDSSRTLAVGRVVGGQVVDAAKSIYGAAKAASETDDGRLRAVKAAQAVMSAYSLTQQGSAAGANIADGKPANSSGSLIKIGTELALTNKKSTSEYTSEQARQANLNAGGTLSIVANGKDAASQGDIHVVGSTLKATDTELVAKHNILLESAQNRSDWDNQSSNNKTAIGASFNIGEQNGFTLDLGASLGKNLGKGKQVDQVNTHLETGSLLLVSGKDTTLAGAQVHADKVQAGIGGDLSVTSRQDEASSKQTQKSAGFGASICIPPICYGSTVTGSASLAGSKMDMAYKAVTEQTGIYVGIGGYDIDVNGTTRLTGGVIASDATADKNRLSTDRLEFSDIRNRSEIKAQSASISASYSSGGQTKAKDTIAASSGVGGGLPLSLKESETSLTRSAVSEGTLEVRNAQGRFDTVGLSRDTANANGALDRPDEKAMQTRLELIQSTAALGQSVVNAIAQAKEDEARQKKDKAEASGSAQDRADAELARAEAAQWKAGGDNRWMADITTGLLAAGLGGAGGATGVGILANTTAADTYKAIGDFADKQAKAATDDLTKAAWGEGGAARVALHAAAGALQGLAGGGAASGAAGAGVSAAVMPAIGEALRNSGLKADEQKAVSTLVATSLGVTAGGSNGRAIGGNTASGVELYNRQLHPDEESWISEHAKEFAKKYGVSEQEATERLAQQAVKNVDFLHRSLQADGDDQLALDFLKEGGQFVNELGEKQKMFTVEGNQLFRSELYADTATPSFYKNYIRGGVSRSLEAGLAKELKDYTVETGADALALANAAVEHPDAALQGLWEGVKSAPKSVVDDFVENGKALGEGGAVALTPELREKLNELYGTDVSTAQRTMLLLRAATSLMAAGTAGKVGKKVTEATDKKVSEILAEAKAKKSSGDGLARPCCFAAGTQVSTPQGDRAIESLKVGDVVWSKPEKGGKPFAAAILATHQRSDQPIYRLKLRSVHGAGKAEGETLLVTPSHPFYVPAKRDFIRVIDLKPGDLLQSLADGDTENTSSKVESLELYLPQGKTYNLTVDVGHTFYVGKLKTWVHNTGPCDLPPDYFAGGAKGAGTALETTNPVTVSGSRAIDKAQSYESGVRAMYGDTAFAERQYKALVDGQRVNGVADEVAVIGGKPTAIEAKFVDDWANSIRNPESPTGSKPWSIAEQTKMVDQAKKYSSGFDGGAIYHTNSPELASYYSKMFIDAGVTNFKFVITPVTK